MASVKKHLPVLRFIRECSPVDRRKLIQYYDIDLINTLKECVYNTLKGNIPLSENEISKLKRFKKILRKLFRTDKCLKNTRKIIIQSGGSFLPTLLAPIVAAGEYHFNSRNNKLRK